MKVSIKLRRLALAALLLASALPGTRAQSPARPVPPPGARRPIVGRPHPATPATTDEEDDDEKRPVAVAPLPGPAQPRPAVRYPTRRLRELRADPDLHYAEEGAPEEEGLLTRFLRWLSQWISAIRSTKGGRVAWDTFFYVLASAALVFAVLKLLQVDFAKVFGRASRAAQPLGYEAGPENIHELNFGEAIAQAEAAGNLRLALRLGYLQVLKQLSDQDLIDWQPDKTNQTYLRELAAGRPALRPAFAELTRQFEYVWYGEWPLRPAGYRQLRETQLQLGRQLAGVKVGKPE